MSPTLFDQFARGWRGYVLAALIALASASFGAGRMPVMDLDEARFAQATRQMIETDNYINIRLQDDERNKKPAGIHWLQAAAVNALEPITGRLNVIWPYRIPSALGLMLAAIATLWAGAALVGPRTAFFGAALLSAGLLAGFEGMTAKTDAMLLGFTTLAMAALARLRFAADRPRVLALVFWAAVGCGMMIKGPITLMVAGLALATLAVWERRAAWMKPLLWWPGPALALLIVAPWMIAIGLETGGRYYSEMFFGDLAPKLVGGHEQHFALPGYHTFLLPFLIFPATYALPAAGRLVWRAVRGRRDDEEHAPHRFLLAWAAPVFIVFELLPTKLVHYTLPAYPAIALLCGAGLIAMQRWRSVHPAGVVMFAVSGVVIVALLAAAATFMPGDFSTDLRRAISSGLIGAGIIAFAFAGLIMLRRPAARVGVLVVCALLLSFSLRERLLPEARGVNVSSELVAALTRARLTPRDDRPLWVVGYRQPSLVFMTRTTIRLASPEDAAAGAQPGDALVVEGRHISEIMPQLTAHGLRWVVAEPPVRGLAVGRGDRVSLFVGQVHALNEEAEGAQRQSP